MRAANIKVDGFQNLEHFITYSVINSEPNLTYSSVVSTIRCWAVTSGELQDTTFVRWTSKFSSDADIGKPRAILFRVFEFQYLRLTFSRRR